MEFRLIIKKINNNLTPEEEIVFSKWYQESEHHKRYFENVKTNYNADSLNINLEGEWKRLQKSIKPKSSKNIYWKFAVAASVACFFAVSIYFNSKNKPSLIEPVIVDNQILTGTDKAVLTLGDGSFVELEKGKLYETEYVKSDGEELVYSSGTEGGNLEYNYLTIPRGGQFTLSLSDGTQVWLNSDSQLKFPVAFLNNQDREVELVYGEAYFEVTPSSQNNGSKFVVSNTNQKIEVLGTGFNVKAYKDETFIYTTLVHGKVQVAYEEYNQILMPGQQSTINLVKENLAIADVDIEPEISWKEGIFSFDGKSLKDIMKVLSRWYDFDIVFENKKIMDEQFVGVLGRDQTIVDVLKSIKNYGLITNFKIEGKLITIE
ncbi:DUF4974 domain-containing protein [Mangrovimonas sp. CR14]|uniref:FecR family protein n=1 Tax=Mangrovimonas sp. CR14 TaxID=2706120 RepID=UPI001420321D|nr:FecR family protein [Mangrovimonas sp. CR14]NIK93268.1 DUF4974 domain-containing protein [Mangrovimonas sp. CR14]